MIEDAANKGVRHLHIGHYISFEGFKKIVEKNLVEVTQDLYKAALFLKEKFENEDIIIKTGEDYEQEIIMTLPIKVDNNRRIDINYIKRKVGKFIKWNEYDAVYGKDNAIGTIDLSTTDISTV
jgi:hypothetical protein